MSYKRQIKQERAGILEIFFCESCILNDFEYHEICLVFDQYSFQNSLKESTGNTWSRENTIYYNVTPETNLEYINMKEFLSKAKTKHELFFLEF